MPIYCADYGEYHKMHARNRPSKSRYAARGKHTEKALNAQTKGST